MKKALLSLLFIGWFCILLPTQALSQQNGQQWHEPGWETFLGSWGQPVSQTAILKSGLLSDTRWSAISVDLKFNSGQSPVSFGLVLNARNAADFGIIRFVTTDTAVIQAGWWQYGHMRPYFNIKLKQGLRPDKWYRLQVFPSTKDEEWRPWTLTLTDAESGQLLLEQGIENGMPFFGRGRIGLYSNGAQTSFKNFQINIPSFPSMQGALRLAPLFVNGMVLQRNTHVPVWGLAHPGGAIQIIIQGKIYTGKADTSGRWLINIGSLKVTDATAMVITAGHDSIIVKDIAVGEVWLASGQSNMHLKVWQSDVAPQLPRSKDLGLRMFIQPAWPSEEPLFDSGGQWEKADSANARNWSAVAYSFAAELRRKLKIPIGIIASKWGGTAAESWVPREALKADTATLSIWQGYAQGLLNIRQGKSAAFPWFTPGQHHAPGALFNGMIYPHIPFAIRGVIWYQGESNSNRAMQYENLFPLLIKSWREAWHQPNLPFLFVQLPGYDGGQSGANIENAWPEIREAQRLTLQRAPHTGMAIALELGSPTNIHPPFKTEVGKRLANLALHDQYGFNDIVRSGPLYQSAQFQNGAAVVKFKEAAKGLKIRSGKMLQAFMMAGEDHQFKPAQAQIETDGVSVRVWSDQVGHPVAVRYAWANNPVAANLVNSAGLPAAPFRTDNWELFPKDQQAVKK